MTATYHAVAFFCETLLMDKNDRQSLVGIMPTSIKVQEFPAPLALGLFVRITPLPPDRMPIHIEVRYDGGVMVGFDTVSVPASDGDDLLPALHVGIERGIFNLHGPGIMEVFVRIGGGEPLLATVMKVDLAVPPT